jgi:glycosyltransferase involved in cell wall biosynthesis
MKRYFPEMEFTYRKHPELLSSVDKYRHCCTNNVITVAILGALTEIKGASVLYACAKHAKENSLPLKFILFGYSYIDKELRKLGNVVVTGKYDSHRLGHLIAKASPSFVFLPTLCPETYSYTLSEAWLNNLYVVAFDIGAIADRISRNTTLGELIPYCERNNAELITSVLLKAGDKSMCKAELASELVSYSNLRYNYYPNQANN